MHPYRPLHFANEPAPPPRADDDRPLALALVALGAVRVVPAIALGETFGAEATLAALAVVVGAVLLVRGRGRRR
jgi:hypothetical protein